MVRVIGVAAVAAGLLAMVPAADAQVSYRHYRPAAPVPYGYPAGYGVPVPYGVLQPYEAYGTSPSFEINTNPYARGPVVRVVRRCQYPDGWNTTDFVRDVNGTPAGLDHTCPVGGPGSERVAY